MSKIKTAIVGATGYTGSELVRILSLHPNVSIEAITSESYAGQKFSDIHSSFTGLCDIELIKSEDLSINSLDAIFLALPHGIAMNYAKKYYDKVDCIIDLSADFRLPSPDIYEKWYPKDHKAKELFKNALLPILPLIKENLIKPDTIIVDAKSGVTGAGAKAKQNTHFPHISGNFNAYGLFSHRHTPEIECELASKGNKDVQVLFTPHLLPVDRGILSTIYMDPIKTVEVGLLRDFYQKYYGNAYFVRNTDKLPQIKNVKGSNFADVYVDYDERSGKIMAFGAIDNLIKGAAGQAVQNLNIRFGMNEELALEQFPIYP